MKTPLNLSSKELTIIQTTLDTQIKEALKLKDYENLGNLSLLAGKIDTARREAWNDEHFGVYEDMIQGVLKEPTQAYQCPVADEDGDLFGEPAPEPTPSDYDSEEEEPYYYDGSEEDEEDAEISFGGKQSPATKIFNRFYETNTFKLDDIAF